MFDYLAVIQLAGASGWRLIQDNPTSRVLGFTSDSEGNTQRVNVYYTTGTLGTSLWHPTSGKTQLFRRNVSMDQLRAIFWNPRAHTGAGYYARQTDPGRPEPSAVGTTGVWACLSDSRQTDSFLGQFDNRHTVHVALGRDGCYFCLDSDGAPWWGGHIPKGLDNKLRGRQRWLPPADYVSLGAGDLYFVQFSDGQMQWSGECRNSLIEALLRNDDCMVEILAFASDGGWFVQWEDGTKA